MADSGGRRSASLAQACCRGGDGSSEWLAFQVDRTSASDVARSRDVMAGDGQEVALSSEWTRLESVVLHCTSPEPLLDTERRRVVHVDAEDVDSEWGRTSTVNAGMS